MKCIFCRVFFFLSELPDPQVACCATCGGLGRKNVIPCWYFGKRKHP